MAASKHDGSETVAVNAFTSLLFVIKATGSFSLLTINKPNNIFTCSPPQFSHVSLHSHFHFLFSPAIELASFYLFTFKSPSSPPLPSPPIQTWSFCQQTKFSLPSTSKSTVARRYISRCPLVSFFLFLCCLYPIPLRLPSHFFSFVSYVEGLTHSSTNLAFHIFQSLWHVLHHDCIYPELDQLPMRYCPCRRRRRAFFIFKDQNR